MSAAESASGPTGTAPTPSEHVDSVAGATRTGRTTTDVPDTGQLEFGAQIAHRSTGKLGEFNRAGVLGVADIHTASTLGRICDETREDVQLAAALTVRALRTGSVCIDLRTIADAVFADTTGEDANTPLDVSTLAWPEPSDWLEACSSSPMIAIDPAQCLGEHEDATAEVGSSPDGSVTVSAAACPLRMAGGLLYLQRYWQQQETVRRVLHERATADPPDVDLDRLRDGLDRLFDSSGLASDEPDLQRLAAAVGVVQWVSVVAGGPGTGKTTTVAGLLALLHDQSRPAGPPDQQDQRHAPGLRVALAAPTGKAAARLEEAVRGAAEQMTRTGTISDSDGAWIGQLSSSTLHRLLGWLPQSRSRFRHNARNHLPYDVVVVDEMSMVSLTLMSRLLEALRPDTRLILVGDPDQLSSVEAGAVLADIVGAPGQGDPHTDAVLTTVQAADPLPQAGPQNGVVRLEHTWRFGGAIDDLAHAIRTSDDGRVIDILRSADAGLTFTETTQDPVAKHFEPDGPPAPTGQDSIPGEALQQLRRAVQGAGREIHDAAQAGDVDAALGALDRHRLLCAHRRGPFGVTRWSVEAERWLADVIPGYGTSGDDGPTGEWYAGQPLLITANDYELGLYNGDTGVVVQAPEGLRAAFARGGSPTLISPARLDSVQTMQALTVHRAQGSQFQTVTFVVPPPESPLLTRELLYTAVTRATDQVHVIGSEAAIRRATRRPANRASGLRSRLGGR